MDLAIAEKKAGLGSRACAHVVQASRVGIVDTATAGFKEGEGQVTTAAIAAELAACRRSATAPGRG